MDMDRDDDDGEENVLAPKEPQVSSNDPAERKAARALRIKRRQEALKRADQPLEDFLKDEEPNLIEQATASAAQELQRLGLDGAAKVTNVKVTTDEREVLRRALFSDKMKESLAKIEAEAEDAQLQYEAITAHWNVMLTIKDPLEIDAEMKEQSQKCEQLLQQKNRLIDELKSDLKQKDQAYYDDLDKQDKDIKELSARIEKQIGIMQKAYEKQIFLIEQAINIEREALIDHNNKRWEALYKQRDKEEIANMEYKFEKLEEHKQEMEVIMWDHHAKYREAKIELETLIQELQKELEKLKATCLINTEKIGYNYQVTKTLLHRDQILVIDWSYLRPYDAIQQHFSLVFGEATFPQNIVSGLNFITVLKKREEENVFVRSQQKRKLNKMSDVANALRSKIRKAAEDGVLEEIRADAEIVKLMQAMEDLEKKARHFSHVNNYKFSQVWRMSASRCRELSRDVREAEVALHAHVLAQPPPPALAPPKSPLTKYELEQPKPFNTSCETTTTKDIGEMPDDRGKDKLVRHILQVVADNTGFLVEDRLLKLIEKYQKTSQNLCTLDSIFMALEIRAEEDINLLCKIFLNYAFCPVCVDFECASESNMDTQSISGDKSLMRTRSSLGRSSMSMCTSRSTHVGFRTADLTASDNDLVAEAEEIIQKYGEIKVSLTSVVNSAEASASSRRMTRGVTVASQPKLVSTADSQRNPFHCTLGHDLKIEPMQVLTALNEFMSVFVPPEKKKLYKILDNVKPPDFSIPSRKLSANEITTYWSQWKDLFPLEKDRLWDGLICGLNDYLTILQERERLHDEVIELRKRNASLRRLVRGELPELPTQRPRYAQSSPPAFTASVPDYAPLPPI